MIAGWVRHFRMFARAVLGRWRVGFDRALRYVGGVRE